MANVDILTKATNSNEICLQIHATTETDSHARQSCFYCVKFEKAQLAAQSLTVYGIALTITENDVPIATTRGHYQAWCDNCSDGLNDDIYECTSWIVNHKLKRH